MLLEADHSDPRAWAAEHGYSLPDASRAGLSFARRRVEGAPVDAPRMAVL